MMVSAFGFSNVSKVVNVLFKLNCFDSYYCLKFSIINLNTFSSHQGPPGLPGPPGIPGLTGTKVGPS